MTDDTTLIREVAVSYRGAGRKAASPLRAPGDAAAFMRATAADDAREHFLATGDTARSATRS